ncbi:MAG: hypothetical protein EBV86_02590 [Marivivens sp.]|nr:hypothetical protein [Marivivens sp.]
MSRFVSGKYAFGFCDRTGFRYKLADLKPEYVSGVMTGMMVGKDVWDPDQPQNFLGKLGDYTDPQSLENPRPDTSQEESRRLSAFNPVGNGNAGSYGNIVASSASGSVTVVIT